MPGTRHPSEERKSPGASICGSKGFLDSYTVHEVLMASILRWFAIPSCSGSLFVRDLVDTEEIKKRWKEYMEELYKKNLNELDYYDGMVIHPEPDILECEVKWALRSTAVNKASGCDEITE